MLVRIQLFPRLSVSGLIIYLMAFAIVSLTRSNGFILYLVSHTLRKAYMIIAVCRRGNEDMERGIEVSKSFEQIGGRTMSPWLFSF